VLTSHPPVCLPLDLVNSPTHQPARRRCLVTGGAGFIGSHLVERLLARGDHVIVVDNLSTGRQSNLPPAPSGDNAASLRFIRAELSEILPALTQEASGAGGATFDEVYHLAAAVGVKLVIDDPIGSIETNVAQTGELLRFVQRTCPRAALLIASSSEVYGKSERIPFREEDDVTYGPTTKSRWSYACSKAIDEYLALAYHQQHGLRVVIARFFNTVGPRQVGDYGMVLPRFVGAALRNEPITVHGDGRQTRCFCDVRDVASVLPRMLATPACVGRVFNVGGDRSISMIDLAQRVKTTLSSSSEVRLIPYDQAYSVAFEDLRQREPDLSRLRATVGFEPEFTLERTIADLAEELGARAPEAPGSGGSAIKGTVR